MPILGLLLIKKQKKRRRDLTILISWKYALWTTLAEEIYVDRCGRIGSPAARRHRRPRDYDRREVRANVALVLWSESEVYLFGYQIDKNTFFPASLIYWKLVLFIMLIIKDNFQVI